MRESCCVLTPQDRFSWGGLLLCCADSELFLPWTDHCSGYISRTGMQSKMQTFSSLAFGNVFRKKAGFPWSLFRLMRICSLNIRQIFNSLTPMMNLSSSKHVE